MGFYKVVITDQALKMLEEYIGYIQYKLINVSAAKRVWADAMETRRRLSFVAGSMQYCRKRSLRELGYRCIGFTKHCYIMLYRICDKTVYVEAIYHESQDYENIFSKVI